MRRALFLAAAIVLLGSSFWASQDEKKVPFEPKKGAFIPGPFESFNVNGPGKGRPRCLVSSFGLYPAVLVFARETADEKDAAVLDDFLEKLDKTAADFQDRAFCVGVVFLSPDARDAANSPEKLKENAKQALDLDEIRKAIEQDKELAKRLEALPEEEREAARKAAELAELGKRLAKLGAARIQEAVKQKEVRERLEKRAEKLKHVIIATYPAAGPKEYHVDPKAGLVVMFYERMKIRDARVFGEGEMQADDVDKMIQLYRSELPLRKKNKL